MNESSFIFLGGAELPWIYPLGAALARHCPTRLIRLGAAWRPPSGPVSWPLDDHPPALERVAWTYPPGFNGRLAFLFTGGIRRRLRRAIRELEKMHSATPYVVTPDPRFARYTDVVTPGRLVYLNYDDYGAYGRGDAAAETSLVHRARAVLCSSRYQRERFAEQYPDRADAVFHLPHGVHESFFRSASPPSVPSIAVVGALTKRYDWMVIEDVIARLPHIEFVFAGEIAQPSGGREDWRDRMQRVLAQRNVRHLRGVRYRDTAAVYEQTSANWMPYDAASPFVKASCPLKLGDGLASGRPVVSADVPECRLYPEWVGIHRCADQAVTLIERAIEDSRDDARRAAQVAFARRNTWDARAARLLEILGAPAEARPV